MDRQFLTPSRQDLDSLYKTRRALDLLKRGYTKNEVAEIYRRCYIYMQKNVDPHAVTGEIDPMKRDFSVAIAEVLADSADIALGHYRGKDKVISGFNKNKTD